MVPHAGQSVSCRRDSPRCLVPAAPVFASCASPPHALLAGVSGNLQRGSRVVGLQLVPGQGPWCPGSCLPWRLPSFMPLDSHSSCSLFREARGFTSPGFCLCCQACLQCDHVTTCPPTWISCSWCSFFSAPTGSSGNSLPVLLPSSLLSGCLILGVLIAANRWGVFSAYLMACLQATCSP